jgi:hypothetical protein
MCASRAETGSELGRCMYSVVAFLQVDDSLLMHHLIGGLQPPRCLLSHHVQIASTMCARLYCLTGDPIYLTNSAFDRLTY